MILVDLAIFKLIFLKYFDGDVKHYKIIQSAGQSFP